MQIIFLPLLYLSLNTAMAGPVSGFFDGHIHYSRDVWEALPPQRALELLGEAGIARALVSGTPGEGAERLYRAAPDRVVPFLRPYQSRAGRYTWFRDATVPDYLREQLARIPYRGIGEFHLDGEHARSPVVADVIALARSRGLALHAHTDGGGIRALLDQAPDIPVIWAHGGFDEPESLLRDLLDTHAQLYIELSFREGLTLDGQLTAVWEALFTDFPSRFLVGMDTYSPGRWMELQELTAMTRGWLAQLPAEVAQAIAWDNAARLFPVVGQ
ncbi:MAG: amidohydrolase family protein [Thiohalobacterales bacterium]|nr:amidohydrolase family protein [Thiohalobacterales bacterium]